MKKPAEAEAKRVRADKSLSPEQRAAALQAIQAETERAARAALGDKAFEALQKAPAAYWLKGLNPGAVAGPRLQTIVSPGARLETTVSPVAK